MVCGLVQQQRVGRFDQHPRECDTITLSPAQRFDRFFLIIPGEQERARNPAEEVRLRLAGDLRKRIENGLFRVQGLCLVLGEVMQGDTMATVLVPLSKANTPASILSSVLFPAPFSPTSAMR